MSNRKEDVMRDVAVLGVGMTRFGKLPAKGIKDLVREAVEDALNDAGVLKKDIQSAYIGNAVAGIMTGQEQIRGQVTLTAMGIEDISMFNIESACASSSAGFHLGWMSVASGLYDCVLVVGFEKLYDKDKFRSFQAFGTATDIELFQSSFDELVKEYSGVEIFKQGSGQNRSIFMDMYAFAIKPYMDNYNLTQKHFAKLSVKSHKNGALNPHSQYQQEVTLEEVLNSGDVVFPLTRMMCAPVGDGAAAAILCSKSMARRFTTKPVWVAGSVIGSGSRNVRRESTMTERLSSDLYEKTGMGPEDIDVLEVHDATSPSEIMSLIQLGICKGEDAPKWIDEGYLEINGKVPCNTSGGLVSKGHPVGATGCGQIYEIVTQLKGEAGARQTKNPKVGMTHNGGGIIGIDASAMALHLFEC
jgi:acetyl-CoA acetyltransferase